MNDYSPSTASRKSDPRPDVPTLLWADARRNDVAIATPSPQAKIRRPTKAHLPRKRRATGEIVERATKLDPPTPRPVEKRAEPRREWWVLTGKVVYKFSGEIPAMKFVATYDGECTIMSPDDIRAMFAAATEG